MSVIFYALKESLAPEVAAAEAALSTEHSLLAACTCMTTPEPPCPTCARWVAHYRMVTERHAAACAAVEKKEGDTQ